MLTRLIVACYASLLEAALWFMAVCAAVVGYHFTVPVMHAAGVVLTPDFAWKLFGALVLPVVTLVVLALVIGPFLVLLDVRQAVRGIQAKLDREAHVRQSHPSERREPSI